MAPAIALCRTHDRSSHRACHFAGLRRLRAAGAPARARAVALRPPAGRPLGPVRAVQPADVPVLEGARATDSRPLRLPATGPPDRKSTRLNSSHVAISYAVFFFRKKIEPSQEPYIKIVDHF